MKYHVTWTDKNYHKTREEEIDYPGIRDELVKKLGENLLSEMANNPEMSDKNLKMVLSYKTAVIYSKPGQVEGTVVVEKTPDEISAAILDWLLNG